MNIYPNTHTDLHMHTLTQVANSKIIYLMDSVLGDPEYNVKSPFIVYALKLVLIKTHVHGCVSAARKMKKDTWHTNALFTAVVYM